MNQPPEREHILSATQMELPMSLPSVLIVDDEGALREILGLSVADLGYPVTTAAHGEDALQQAAAAPPGIVLTDIKMPGMDGITLLKKLKGLYPDTEVIMISGHGDMDLAIQSLQFEALDFLTKPIRDELLINALRRASERIAMRRQIREHTENLECIVKEKSARLVELERQIAVGQVVEGLSAAMRGLVESFDEGPSYFNELPCFITIHNQFLEIVASNDLAKNRLGDLTGHQSWEAYAQRQGSGNSCPVWMTIQEGKGRRSHEVLRDKDGLEVPVIVHTAPIFNQEHKVELVIEMSVDVSEVRRLQDELRATREKYQRLFEVVPCYIAVLDPHMQVVEANRRYRTDFGDYRAAPCHQVFSHRDEPCQHCPIQATLIDGGSHVSESVVTTIDGSQHNVLIQSAPVLDEQGNISQVLEIATDITQIRALQDHLSSLGLMLGSMSHGVKGLLTAMDGGAYKIDAGFRQNDPNKVRQGWDIVHDKIGRIKKMVLDILYYAKSREPERLSVNVQTFAKDLMGIVGPKAEAKSVTFRLELPPEAGAMEVDETAMSMALVNFLENAVDACSTDATKRHHEVTLRVTSSPADPGGAGRVQFHICDNGTGMDQETREKMFTLFFSSKGSKGTGLGLFISNKIVDQHGGRITVDSILGEGTSITIDIPRSAAAVSS